jgi:CheY-like chemotaxis protein
MPLRAKGLIVVAVPLIALMGLTSASEILRELTSAPATAAIPVIVLSSDSSEIIDELLANGAAESVAKPFDIHQFMAIIDRYLP